MSVLKSKQVTWIIFTILVAFLAFGFLITLNTLPDPGSPLFYPYIFTLEYYISIDREVITRVSEFVELCTNTRGGGVPLEICQPNIIGLSVILAAVMIPLYIISVILALIWRMVVNIIGLPERIRMKIKIKNAKKNIFNKTHIK